MTAVRALICAPEAFYDDRLSDDALSGQLLLAHRAEAFSDEWRGCGVEAAGSGVHSAPLIRRHDPQVPEMLAAFGEVGAAPNRGGRHVRNRSFFSHHCHSGHL